MGVRNARFGRSAVSMGQRSDKIVSQFEVATRRRKKWDDMERLGLKIARDLPSALAKGTNAFERYRYRYEGNTRDLHYYLEDLPAVLEMLILEMKPEFEAFRRAPLSLQGTSHH